MSGHYEVNTLSENVQVHDSILSIIQAHFFERKLKEQIHEWINYKQNETSIWPELTVYTHFMLEGTSPHIFHAAAQTELIILSLDILDDLQDQDNDAPPWMKVDHAIAMNAATAILTAAIAGDLTSPPIKPDLLKLITAAHNGQHKDIGNDCIDEEQYLQMVSEKSASLITFAVLMGCPDHAAENYPILKEMANHIGIAAQIDNDLRNLTRIDYRNDIVQRKITLSTLFLLEQSDSHLPIVRMYYNNEIEQEKFLSHKQEILHFIDQSGVIEYSNAVQMLYAQQAGYLLEQLHTETHWKNKFEALTISKFLKKV